MMLGRGLRKKDRTFESVPGRLLFRVKSPMAKCSSPTGASHRTPGGKKKSRRGVIDFDDRGGTVNYTSSLSEKKVTIMCGDPFITNG